MAYKNGVVDPYPNLDTHVFSRSLGGSPHPNVKVHNNIDAESIREIKSQAPGNVWVCGGGKLASALISKGLVDNLIVKVNPVLIGHGLRLVDTLERPFKPKLENQKVYANGVVRLDYALGAGRVL